MDISPRCPVCTGGWGEGRAWIGMRPALEPQAGSDTTQTIEEMSLVGNLQIVQLSCGDTKL